MHLNRRLHRARGFTLVELIIVFAVAGILVLLALPSFTQMIRNAQIRSVAEALQNGLRLAQAEAVRGSRLVAFVRTAASPGLNAPPSETGNNWYIQRVPLTGGLDATLGTPSATRAADGAEFIQGGKFTDVASGVIINGATSICFDSDGRLDRAFSPTGVAAFGAPGGNCATGLLVGGTSVLFGYEVTRANPVPGEDRPLRVQVDINGRVRMCDPAKTLSPATPDGC